MATSSSPHLTGQGDTNLSNKVRSFSLMGRSLSPVTQEPGVARFKIESPLNLRELIMGLKLYSSCLKREWRLLVSSRRAPRFEGA